MTEYPNKASLQDMADALTVATWLRPIDNKNKEQLIKLQYFLSELMDSGLIND